MALRTCCDNNTSSKLLAELRKPPVPTQWGTTGQFISSWTQRPRIEFGANAQISRCVHVATLPSQHPVKPIGLDEVSASTFVAEFKCMTRHQCPVESLVDCCQCALTISSLNYTVSSTAQAYQLETNRFSIAAEWTSTSGVSGLWMYHRAEAW
jgi:hypothetical protein